ncbi:hypothetical protein BKA93DRAFT_311157 [Sparassis latifolia]
MIGKLPSSRFAAIYDTLPADAQQALVEKHLIPLLNLVERSRSKKVLGVVTRLQERHAGIPLLDLNAKKAEITALMDELHRDAKRSFVRERSHKSEILSETVDSLTDWLNDIWSVVYEHNVDFMHAHKCLLFVASSLDHIGNGRSGCKCAFTNMYVSVVLKRNTGRRVKSFAINGAHNVEEVLYFIWRDLLLSLLATGSERQVSIIPEILGEIEDMLGWTALERVLYGGKKCPHDYGDDDDDDDDDDEEEEYESEDEDEDGDDEEYIDDETDSKPYFSSHWSYRVSSQMWQLRKHIQDAMMGVFKLTPSLRLYSSLLAISTDPESIESQLMKHLSSIAASSSETFSAALDIHALEDDADTIVSLLDSHSHLLRPRDAPSLQTAVACIAASPFYQAQALQIIEKELLDTARAVRSALLSSFSQVESRANIDEIMEIVKLRAGAPGRQDRVEAWIDAIATPGTAAPNPMAFAAMMMGLPIVPGMEAAEEGDPAGYLDFDPHDPDLDELRDEFRPKLKQRFEGWSDVAISVKGAAMVQLKVYKALIEMMPFLRANDVVEEMVGRLADKPSKHHVCDGLDALLNFVKVQRRKAAMQRSETKFRKDTARAARTAGAREPSTSTTQPAAPVVPPGTFANFFDCAMASAPSNSGMGGMEDVD